MNPNSDLQLVPETLLKKRHDLDALQAKRAAEAITNPRVSRKRISDKSKKVNQMKKHVLYQLHPSEVVGNIGGQI